MIEYVQDNNCEGSNKSRNVDEHHSKVDELDGEKCCNKMNMDTQSDILSEQMQCCKICL